MVADPYTYRVGWSAEDEEYVGTCAEFPGLSWLDEDEDKAFRGIRTLVRETVDEMTSAGEQIPEPFSLRQYSGRLQLRTTPDVHRRLVIEAAESNVSLNRLINSKLIA